MGPTGRRRGVDAFEPVQPVHVSEALGWVVSGLLLEDDTEEGATTQRTRTIPRRQQEQTGEGVDGWTTDRTAHKAEGWCWTANRKHQQQERQRTTHKAADKQNRTANRDQRHRTIEEQHSKQEHRATAGDEATTMARQGVEDHQRQGNSSTGRGDSYRAAEQRAHGEAGQQGQPVEA